MGKGRRNRENTDRRREHYKALRLQATKLESTVKVLSILTLVLMVLLIAFQVLLQGVMYGNLNSGVYEAQQTDAAEISALRHILPTGAIGLGLSLLGTVLTAVLLCRQKPTLSLIGCAVLAAGIAFFIPYVYNLGLLFTFDELAGVSGRGLSFWALIWQHYSTLFPLILLIPAEWCAFVARQKHGIADIMENVTESVSTLNIEEE